MHPTAHQRATRCRSRRPPSPGERQTLTGAVQRTVQGGEEGRRMGKQKRFFDIEGLFGKVILPLFPPVVPVPAGCVLLRRHQSNRSSSDLCLSAARCCELPLRAAAASDSSLSLGRSRRRLTPGLPATPVPPAAAAVTLRAAAMTITASSRWSLASQAPHSHRRGLQTLTLAGRRD